MAQCRPDAVLPHQFHRARFGVARGQRRLGVVVEAILPVAADPFDAGFGGAGLNFAPELAGAEVLVEDGVNSQFGPEGESGDGGGG